MNARTAKKIRQVSRRNTRQSFGDFADAINRSSLRTRLRIIFKILFKKL